MAPAGHIVPAARGGAASPAQGLDFSARGPLTSPRLLWHNVTRRPRRGILGFLSPRFSSPVAADAFISRICRFADLPFCGRRMQRLGSDSRFAGFLHRVYLYTL